ncbi:MAG: site-2 protease family protein, partial [Candidatus Omnitrophica bacterium]|nr:site-2 protease family protein [Candidatus Omnitrophota bacterium]
TFIPGLGALIRLKQYPSSPSEDARVGLAGPLWGLFAAGVCAGVFVVTGWASWGAIAKVGAWINLFNLMPFVPLDGGRGFRALDRTQKWIAVAIIALMWIISHEGLLVLILLVALFNVFSKGRPARPDSRALLEYCGLIILLTLLSMLPVPVGP